MQYKVEIAQIPPQTNKNLRRKTAKRVNFHKGCFLLTRGYIDKFWDFGIFTHIKFGDFGIFDTNNLSKVDTVKREIIELYFDDFLKIDPSGRASQLFMAIPSELSKNASRYQVSSVLSDSERKNLSEVLIAMKDSMVVNFSYHSNDPNVGFALNSDWEQAILPYMANGKQ